MEQTVEKPICGTCDRFVVLDGDEGECHASPCQPGQRVIHTIIVRARVMSGHAKARETLHGSWPRINAHAIGCPVHQDWPERENKPSPATVEDDLDIPF